MSLNTLVNLVGDDSRMECKTRTNNGNAPIPSIEIYKVRYVVSKL